MRPEDSVPTRYSLLRRLKDWDDAAGWREFFDAYWELIYNVARKSGLNDSEAQEVVQETLIAVAKSIGDFKTDPKHGSFKSWLLCQARWRIGDQFRARRREAGGGADGSGAAMGYRAQDVEDGTRTQLLDRVADPADDPLERTWQKEWEQHLLRVALQRVQGKVTIKQFQMYDLHVTQGLSVRDTAKALGTTVAAVYMAKSRVGRVLRHEIRALSREQ